MAQGPNNAQAKPRLATPVNLLHANMQGRPAPGSAPKVWHPPRPTPGWTAADLRDAVRVAHGLPPLQAKNQPGLVSRTVDGINWLWEKGVKLFGAPSSPARLEDSRYHRRALDGLLGPGLTVEHGSIIESYIPDPCKLEVWDRHQLSDLFRVIGKPFTRALDTLSFFGLGQCLKLNCVGFDPLSTQNLGTIPIVSFHAPGGSVEYTMMLFFDTNTTALMSESELAALQSENCDHDGLLENVRILASLNATDLKPGSMLMLTDGEFADVLASVPHCELKKDPDPCVFDDPLASIRLAKNSTEGSLTAEDMIRLRAQVAAMEEAFRRYSSLFSAGRVPSTEPVTPPPAGPVSLPPKSTNPLFAQLQFVEARLAELLVSRQQLQVADAANLSAAGNSTASLADIDKQIALLTEERNILSALVHALWQGRKALGPQPTAPSPNAPTESPDELMARIEAMIAAMNNRSTSLHPVLVPAPPPPVGTGRTTTTGAASSTGHSTTGASTTHETGQGTSAGTSTGTSSGSHTPDSTSTSSSASMPAPAAAPEPMMVSADDQPAPLDGWKLGGLLATVVAANVVVGYAVYKTKTRVAA